MVRQSDATAHALLLQRAQAQADARLKKEEQAQQFAELEKACERRGYLKGIACLGFCCGVSFVAGLVLSLYIVPELGRLIDALA